MTIIATTNVNKWCNHTYMIKGSSLDVVHVYFRPDPYGLGSDKKKGSVHAYFKPESCRFLSDEKKGISQNAEGADKVHDVYIRLGSYNYQLGNKTGISKTAIKADKVHDLFSSTEEFQLSREAIKNDELHNYFQNKEFSKDIISPPL